MRCLHLLSPSSQKSRQNSVLYTHTHTRICNLKLHFHFQKAVTKIGRKNVQEGRRSQQQADSASRLCNGLYERVRYGSQNRHDSVEGSKAILVKNLYLACDPDMRTRMKKPDASFITDSYYAPGAKFTFNLQKHLVFPSCATSWNLFFFFFFWCKFHVIVQPIVGFGVAKVADSGHPDFKEGDLVWGLTGWEEYSLIQEPETLFKIKHADVPLSYYTGVLGKAFKNLYEVLAVEYLYIWNSVNKYYKLHTQPHSTSLFSLIYFFENQERFFECIFYLLEDLHNLTHLVSFTSFRIKRDCFFLKYDFC
ncbi:Alcohol dehydrogenase, C-terminal [Cinnamomum micranthum f. kanehirae]|uniref:Alcohol dehydrogenase, C-terminal n=1 Tax=Cinnamomum micranthum f. kanehirae TaxID=337451 RepID=A0A443Q150_9MAGN|nr:Alcohol dehydrogenase, C-terminal [Cinnamomum micranthum f. kanehirae]